MDIYSEAGLAEIQNWRYATQLFQKGVSISDETWSALEETLVQTPSSYNLQPWKFVVVTDHHLKTILRPLAADQAQVEDCSHFVIICARTRIDSDYVQKYIDRCIEVRGRDITTYENYRRAVTSDLVSGYRSEINFEWATRQCYVALGHFIISAALLGVDTCPIEGFSPERFDVALGLSDTGYKSVVCCAAGYRSMDDNKADLPKIRFKKEHLIDRR